MAQPFRYETRIRFVDTDASGRIHYTSLFKFFEAAETELFRSFDISYTKGTFNFPSRPRRMRHPAPVDA